MSGDTHETRMRKDGRGIMKVSAIEKQGVPKGWKLLGDCSWRRLPR